MVFGIWPLDFGIYKLYTDSMSRLSTLAYTFLLLGSIILAFFWIEIPQLSLFSLQAFCAAILFYLVLKKIQKSSLWQLIPATMSVEMALALFAFLILIGSTGNLSSNLFFLSYIYLYFLVLASPLGTSIFITCSILLFHYALGMNSTSSEIIQLLTLPVMLIFYIFIRLQYQKTLQKDQELASKEATVDSEKQELTSFSRRFLQPKLTHLNHLSSQLLSNFPENEKLQDLHHEVASLQEHLEGYVVQKDETQLENLDSE